MRALVIGPALLMLTTSWAVAWPVHVGSLPTKLATEVNGDVLSAFPVRVAQGSIVYDVTRFRGSDGRFRWRHRIKGTGREQSTEINGLIPLGDDTVVVGSVLDTDGADFLVARLAKSGGRERWRARLRGQKGNFYPSYNQGFSVATDVNGDVLVTGVVQNMSDEGGNYGDVIVAKLDGGTGSEQWRSTSSAGGSFVAGDRSGDVIAAAASIAVGGAARASVVKLSGRDSTLLWRRELEGVWRMSALPIDAEGDGFLASSAFETDGRGNDFCIIKLAGRTGEILWIDRESASSDRWEEATQVIVDASGAVFASGMVDDGAGGPGQMDGEMFTVIRL